MSPAPLAVCLQPGSADENTGTPSICRVNKPEIKHPEEGQGERFLGEGISCISSGT